MRSKDQILLEDAYSKIVDDENKSKFQKKIESLTYTPEVTIDKTSEMKGNPIPIKDLEVGNIYDVLVTRYHYSDGNKIKIDKTKEEGLKCEKSKGDPYKIGSVFMLKGPSSLPGNRWYDINLKGDTSYGDNVHVTVYESDVTPEEFENRVKKGTEAYYAHEKEYKQRHGSDSSPWD
jgi:hypothetical protein